MSIPKYYLTASLLNSWVGGYDSFLDMLYRRDREPTQQMQDGIEFERKVVDGEIEELKPYADGALYQEFVCKKCEGYMLLGFCDLIQRDTIYDIKFVSNYMEGKYNNSCQHLIYLYCTDMEKFEYIIGKGKRYLEIYFEKQPRNDERLKALIRQFNNWLEITNLKEVYQKNYSTNRYIEQIENCLYWQERT